MNRRIPGLVLAAAALLPLGGCLEKEISQYSDLELYMLLLGAAPPAEGAGLTLAAVSSKKTVIDTTKGIYFQAYAAGLSGGYEISISDGGETGYGGFSGTTKVKGGRFITIKDAGTEGLLSMVATLVSEQVGGEVTIEKAKAKVSAYQTPGGVQAVWKAKVTFKGVVTSGSHSGRKIRGGKMGLAGVYPEAD